MKSIRDDGQAVGQQATDQLDNRKSQIQEKSEPQSAIGAPVMVVVMAVAMMVMMMRPRL